MNMRRLSVKKKHIGTITAEVNGSTLAIGIINSSTSLLLLGGRKKKIECLLNDNEEWVYDQDSLMNMGVGFYKNLFSLNDDFFFMFDAPNLFPQVEGSLIHRLHGLVSLEEIRASLFSMGNYMSPGADGLHALFFKSQWEYIHPMIFSFVQSIFADPSQIKEVNHTLITLIPKVDSPERISNFRPISLCNVSYKIITKLLTQRLKPLMPKLVSPNQSSFVPGRQGIDNIIILQEAVHSMRSLKGKKGYMILKLDLEKAYDKLRWDFVKDTLHKAGLEGTFSNLVMSCITSSSFALNWNGDVSDTFKPSRGLRQGDPLSPYLFVLCLERLAHSIISVVDNNDWKPFQIGRNGVHLSHIFFADDIILVSEASERQVQLIKNIIDNFCLASGLSVSNSKSKVVFSPNVKDQVAHSLGNQLGFMISTELGSL